MTFLWRSKDWKAHKVVCKVPSTVATTSKEPDPRGVPVPGLDPNLVRWVGNGPPPKVGTIPMKMTRDIEASFPNGAMWMPEYGKLVPLSVASHFFKADLGFPADQPEMVYKELIEAFRFSRNKVARKMWSMDESVKQFEIFMRKVHEKEKLPEWWTDANDEALWKLAKEDDIFRIDKSYNWTNFEASGIHKGKPRKTAEQRLDLIGECIYWEP